MAELKFGSAGVTAREIDLSGPVQQEPTGIPAGVVGTSLKGPAFVPITIGLIEDFYAKFGKTDGKKFGPLAVTEWLRNANSLTYIKVLGVGDGLRRVQTGDLAGSVNSAGFVVGEQLPNPDADGALGRNIYANQEGSLGRTYFLGCFMSESAGSTIFSDVNVGLDGESHPVIRGVLMAPSGVILRLSGDPGTGSPASTLIADEETALGSSTGSIDLTSGKQEFALILNGHKGLTSSYQNVVTASFDMTSPNYFVNVFNTDPFKIQEAGHYLYAHWDIHPNTATITGSSIEEAAFILSGSSARNEGTSTVPNYENFEDRFGHAKTSWFTSQKFGGERKNLFRVHSIDDGSGISTNYKISIENIAPSTDGTDLYGSFDLLVREWNDRDTDTRPVEAWRGLNLNPQSDRYIAKVIGDANVYFDFDKSESAQKLVVDGNFSLNSNLIRVEVSVEVDDQTVDATALPLGFRGHDHLMTSGSAPLADVSATDSTKYKTLITPPVPFRKNITMGSGQTLNVNPLLYWGVQFEHVASLTTPNASTLKNKSLNSHAKYFPNYMENVQNFSVGNNEGVVDTAANGILDADRFNLGAFSLDNIGVVTSSVNSLADQNEWEQAIYFRDGNFDNSSNSNLSRLVTVSDFNQSNRAFLKYSTFMQGGWDGVNLFDEDEFELNNNAVVADMEDDNRGRNNGPNVKAYSKGLDLIRSTTEVDIQVLAIPGIRHPVVTNTAIDVVEERFDAMYVMDIEQLDGDSNLVSLDSQIPDVSKTVDRLANRSLNSSFAAAYFPDVVITDPNTNTNLYAPPSVAVLGALALNDAVGHPWFAPAGFTRGALPTVQETRVKLTKENMDALYDVDINPLTAFPGNATLGINPTGGVVVWGQKTLQEASSALDRVNVRRLMIDIRRDVRVIARSIIFEPNRETTLARFTAAVTPRLRRVQNLAGLDRFRIIIDSSTTTEQDVLNNTIRGVILVQPTKVAEFVKLDFVVTNNIE